MSFFDCLFFVNSLRRSIYEANKYKFRTGPLRLAVIAPNLRIRGEVNPLQVCYMGKYKFKRYLLIIRYVQLSSCRSVLTFMKLVGEWILIVKPIEI